MRSVLRFGRRSWPRAATAADAIMNPATASTRTVMSLPPAVRRLSLALARARTTARRTAAAGRRDMALLAGAYRLAVTTDAARRRRIDYPSADRKRGAACRSPRHGRLPVSYTHLRAHETVLD